MTTDPRSIAQALAWFQSGALRPGADMLGDSEEAAIARRVHACFHMFPDVLQLIFRMTIFRPGVDHQLARGGPYENYAQLREGQDQVAAALLHYLDLHERLERTDHERRSRSDRPARADDAGESGFTDLALTDPGLALR